MTCNYTNYLDKSPFIILIFLYLQDPQTAIPKGSLLAILLTSLSYLLMAVVAGCTVLRDATGNATDYINGSWPTCEPNGCKYGLMNNFQVITSVGSINDY